MTSSFQQCSLLFLSLGEIMSTRGKYLSLKLLGSKISSIIKEGNTYHFVLYIALFSILLIRGGNVYSTSGNFKNVLFESSRSSIWGGRQSHVLNSINISNLFSRVNVGSEPLISEDLCIRVNTEIESVCQRSGNKLTITAKSAQTDSLLIACVIIKRGEERILLDAQNFSFSAGKLIIPDLVAGDSVYVDIKDTQGCKVQVATFIPIITPPQLTISATERTCRNDGAINVTVQGGGAPYIFEWSNGATTQNLIGVGAGTYALRVTDKNGCLATASVRIESYEKPTLAFKFNDATCRSPWASAFAIVGGGQGPYTFYWCNGVTTQGNPQIAPGSCAVTVVDARGCQVTDTLVVRNPIPTISLDVSHGTCGRRGAIRANVIGGTGPYVYMWEDEPGLNVSERTIVRPGRYNLQVIDIYGCTASASTTILSSPAIEAFISVEFSNCQKVANLIAIARGGTPPYSYSWSNGVTIAQNENVLPGIYTVRVTDVVGCTYVSSIEVPYRPPLSLDVVTEPATCQKRGKAKAIASGGTGNYRYSWSCAFADPHQSEIDWLPEGRCSVTVYDDAGCSVSENFVISKLQDVRLRLEVVPIFCNLPGTVRAVVEGASSYQINWSNGARGDIIHVFTPGIYTATVTTSEGCYAQASVEVIGSPGPSVVVEKIPPTCFYLGQLRARVRGGRAPYRLEWSNGATTEVVSNLHPGTYTLRVTDANGCVAENQVTLEGSTPLFMRVLTTAATCTSGGSARAVVTGGSGNYRYMWNCILSATNTAFVHNLPVGECSVTVRDDKGCESTQTFAIAAPQSPVVYLPSQVIIGCGRQAYVQAQVTGGEEPYQFIWSNGHQGNILRPLYPGEYTVRVLDKQGCRASATTHVHILTPPLLSIQTQASGCVPSGSAEVSIMQGAAPYRIEWSNGVTTAKNTRLAPGIYRVTVIDANGCRSDTSIIVEKAPDLEVAVKPQAATCLKPGQAEVTVTRGSGSYYYNWHCGSLNPNAPYHYNLPVGECAVTVYDSITGCTATRTFTIAGPTWPQVTFTVTPISCTPGSIQANVSSGTPPYTYWWQNGSTSNSLHNIIVEGNYSLTVIDAKGCSTQATAAIASIPPLQVVVQKKDATCLESGSAKAMVSGGAAPYMYYWSNGAITPEVNNLLPGSYTLTVTDGNHCTTSASFVIEAGRSLDVQIETQNPTTCLGRGGARAIVNGGVEPYTYRWFCSSRISHLNYIDNVAPGYCFVQITDAAGCSITREFIIGAPSGPEVSLHRLDTPCQNEGAVLKAIAQPNGFEPYTYFWSNG
ncbi:MAG: SprB repeat-containing protein, partial [Bacteroidia bacterium]|nr:SprB repeat-containing protein [Bacteroidia bacterium]